jgi:hypothetical protein
LAFPFEKPRRSAEVCAPPRYLLGMVDQSDAGQLKQVWANEIRLRF